MFRASSAAVLGSETVNEQTAIMYGAVVRGDLELIQIGAYVTIGENSELTAEAVDGTMSPSDAISTGLPVEPELYVGDHSLVEAGITLRGCRLAGVNVIGHCKSIGEGAVIGQYSIACPGRVLEDGTEIPGKDVWGGNPARKSRDATEDEQIKHMQEVVSCPFPTIDCRYVTYYPHPSISTRLPPNLSDSSHVSDVMQATKNPIPETSPRPRIPLTTCAPLEFIMSKHKSGDALCVFEKKTCRVWYPFFFFGFGCVQMAQLF